MPKRDKAPTAAEREADYKDYYNRALRVHSPAILARGGGKSFAQFKVAVAGEVTPKHVDVMESTPRLQHAMYTRHYQGRGADPNVKTNATGRYIVPRGQSLSYKSRTYKGGQYVPHSYFGTPQAKKYKESGMFSA